MAPAGWQKTTLGSLGRYLNGRAFKKDEWALQGRPIIRIQNLTGSSSVFNYFEGDVEDRYVVRPGDLLVSWAATLGAYFWHGQEGVLNQHIFKVESNIDPRFHKHLLDHKLSELMKHTHGSGMVHITRGRFDSLPVVVPPLDEQRRIVAILEDHLSRLDAAGTGLRLAARRLARLREVALAYAVAESKLSEGVTIHHLGDLAKIGSGMTPLRGNKAFYDGGTIPWITSGDLHQGRITEAKNFVTVAALEQTSLKMVPAGSLLIAMYGEGKTRGTAAELAIDATTNQACAAVTLHDQALRSWVRLVLDANYAGLRRLASGGVQPNLNLSLVKAIEVPVPLVSVRETLTRRVDEVDRAAADLGTELRKVEQRGERLRIALLASAFSGHLTGSVTGPLPREMIEA